MTMVTLGVRDIGRAATFYKQLGWKESVPHNRHTCFFQLNGITLALYPHAALASRHGQEASLVKGIAGVSLSLSLPCQQDVDRLVRLAERAGATVLRRPGTVYWGGYSAYFSDPDGHMWEATYNPFLASNDLPVPGDRAEEALLI